MDDFVAFINSGRLRHEHPVIRALLAHFFLVTIHPFGDGNGRVSRLVEAAILYQGGYNVPGFYGLSNYFYRNRDEYIRSLQECRRTQPFDVTSFVSFGLVGFAAELRGKTKLNRMMYRSTMQKDWENAAGFSMTGSTIFSISSSERPSRKIPLRRSPPYRSHFLTSGIPVRPGCLPQRDAAHLLA